MDSLRGRLLDLVQKLEALGPRPSLVHIAQAVESCRLSSADVASFIHRNRQNYNRAAVVIREDFELLVMTWLPGQAKIGRAHV